MSLKFGILGLLAQRSGSGYDLLKRFQASLANVWPATQSQLYTELGKLAEDGLIEVAGQGSRGRTDYAITPVGAAELRRWLEQPLADNPRSATLLQIFLLGETDTAIARHHFEAFRSVAAAQEAHLLELDRTVAWDDSAADRYGRAVLNHGILRARTDQQWAFSCLNSLGDAD